MGRVNDLMRRFSRGDIPFAQVERELAGRTWSRPAPAMTWDQLVDAEFRGESGLLVEDSWDEVAAAHAAGVLNDEQYGRLLRARR